MREELESRVRAAKQRIIERDQYRCAWCRKHFARKSLTIDHLVPRSQWRNHWGNKHHESNLVACCHDCGRIKADVWLDGITLSPGADKDGQRTVNVHWNMARYCMALLRTSTPRRTHVPRNLGE